MGATGSAGAESRSDRLVVVLRTLVAPCGFVGGGIRPISFPAGGEGSVGPTLYVATAWRS